MATAMIYDTLKLAEQLEHEAGFDAPRARAMARILAENTGGNLASREDIRELATKSELLAAREDIRDLATKSEFLATKSELLAAKGELRAEIQDLRGDIRGLYWITGTTLAGVTGLLGIAATLALHFMRLG